MTLSRKDAAKRLATEIGARRLLLDGAPTEEERAYRSADLAILFLDNLDFIRDYLAGIPTGTRDISLRSMKDRLREAN